MDFKTQRNVLNSEKLMMISGGSTDGSWEGFGSGLHKTVNTVVMLEQLWQELILEVINDALLETSGNFVSTKKMSLVFR